MQRVLSYFTGFIYTVSSHRCVSSRDQQVARQIRNISTTNRTNEVRDLINT